MALYRCQWLPIPHFDGAASIAKLSVSDFTPGCLMADVAVDGVWNKL